MSEEQQTIRRPPFRGTPVERFWRYVQKGEGCWNWSGPTTGLHSHYGAIWVNNSYQRAHRYSWELHNGPIPEGLLVCHTCDNPLCVRPDHLFLGSYADNAHDMHAKGRGRESRKTHCLRGHPFSADNTNRRGTFRQCRECRRGKQALAREQERLRVQEKKALAKEEMPELYRLMIEEDRKELAAYPDADDNITSRLIVWLADRIAVLEREKAEAAVEYRERALERERAIARQAKLMTEIEDSLTTKIAEEREIAERYRQSANAEILAEREACAKIADRRINDPLRPTDGQVEASFIAEAIRARSLPARGSDT